MQKCVVWDVATRLFRWLVDLGRGCLCDLAAQLGFLPYLRGRRPGCARHIPAALGAFCQRARAILELRYYAARGNP